MICPRCQSDRLFKFEPDKNLPAPIASLPTVCRNCSLVLVDGKAVSFPAELETQMRTLAEAAAAVGEQAVKDFDADPDRPIAAYFGRIYRDGYLAGFWRSLLFWRHNAKEGRVRRLRELWQRANHAQAGKPGVSTIHMATSEYTEFKQLLELGENDAPRPSNERSPLPVRSS